MVSETGIWETSAPLTPWSIKKYLIMLKFKKKTRNMDLQVKTRRLEI